MSFRDYVVHAVAMLTMVCVIASARLVAPSSDKTDIIVYEHSPAALAPWPVLDIYLLDTEGRKSRALTNDGHSHTPRWSPDGQRILFIHDTARHAKARETGDTEFHYPFELYVMNRDGSNPRLLRRLETPILQAAWSPDDESIAATYSPKEWAGTARPGEPPSPPVTGLFLLPLDGRGTSRLLFRDGFTPAWSPDGRRLALSAHLPDNHWAVHVGNADGFKKIQLTDPSLDAGSPSWSPDGRHIAFDARVGGHTEISTMDENGSRQRQLTTDHNWECSAPSWSPDGERIAFHCSPVSSPCSAGNAGPNLNTSKCVRRVLVTPAFDPQATPLQLTKEDGAFPVFAPKK
jgi:Tol biopolymer transport system component